jgi:ATP-dependent DNA helicase RecG
MTSLTDILKQNENENIEFKKAENSFSYEDLCKYITAIANEKGGFIFLGVDNSGQVTGSKAFPNIQKLKIDILSNTNFSKKIRIEAQEIIEDSKRVLMITAPSREVGEAISYKGAYLMRSGESLVAMDLTTLKNIINETREDFSRKLSDKATINDLDVNALEKIKELWSKKARNPEILKLDNSSLLKDLDLIRDGKLTYSAIILAGNKSILNSELRNAELTFEYRKDENSIEYQDRIDYREAFVLFFDNLWSKINSRNEQSHIQEGFLIKDIYAFNEEVIREGILNAISHRDYKTEASIFVKQYPNKIEVTSPGGFLPGITPSNLIHSPSNPRNRLLIEVLQKMGFVERSGQGVDKIFRETIKEGKGLPNYEKSNENFVTLEIQSIIKDKEFVKYIDKIVNEKQIHISINELVLLEKIKETNLLRDHKEEADKLVKKGLVEKYGTGKGVKYMLSKKYYQHIGKAGEYTKRLGLDKSRNMQLIMEHLKRHKKGYMQEFFEALGEVVPKSTINRYLRELKAGKIITFQGNPNISTGKNRGYWELV